MKSTNEKGITLIALIITVIILVILLALTELILPDDLFKKAEDADKYTVGVIEDSQRDIDRINVPDIKDDIVPQSSLTVKSIVDNIGSTTVTIIAEGNDSDGKNMQFTLKINETGKTYGPSTSDTNKVTWNITELTANTNYTYIVTVSNEDGKTASCSGGFKTQEEGSTNTAPAIITNELNGKTTTSFTINANATDTDGDSLTYKLYTSTSENGTYTLAETSAVTPQNTQVTLSKTGLTQYTTYWWYITVTDGTETTTSGKQSVKTYCPGPVTTTCTKGYKCTESTTTTRQCDSCQGSGGICNGTASEGTAVKVKCPGSGCMFAAGDSNSAAYQVTRTCSTCGATDTIVYGFCTCGWSQDKTFFIHNSTCTSCNGTGYQTIYTVCKHGEYSYHWYCDEHNVALPKNTTTHTVTTSCGHTGATGMHDS